MLPKEVFMDQKREVCPHCGGTETAVGKQAGHGQVTPQKAWTVLRAQNLYHVICLSCGTVIRSYIEDPHDLV